MSERTLQDEIEIIEMCLPLYESQGGIWFRNNHNFADATFVDYGACRAFARAASALPTLVAALKEAERFMDYFANARTTFVGPGTPTTCLWQIRDALSALRAEEGKS